MKTVTLLTSFLILFCMTQYSLQQHAGSKKKLSKPQFDVCVKKCFDQFSECTSEFKEKWKDFSIKKIQREILIKLRDCCLKGERDSAAGPEVSFATCVQKLCEAELWGLVFLF